MSVRVIALATIREFWELHSEAEQPLRAWLAEVRASSWATPAELKTKYRSASILKNGRVVFNISGNAYRLVTAISYKHGIVFIKFVGTHAEYDRINAQTIEYEG